MSHQPTRRIAILSDPHGDLVALRKVVEHLDASGPVDEVLLGGDLAQGGAQPAQIVDYIHARDWRSVRGNADDLLVRLADGWSAADVMREAERTHESLPQSVVERARWSVEQLGGDRIDFLRSLPMSIRIDHGELGSILLVHATPWSTEDVVLPDADDELASRMLTESQARFVLYGHIHTQYLRRLSGGVIASVGAISGSNDTDPRPGYTIVTLSDTLTIEARRVDWPVEERLASYRAAGVDESFSRHTPGRFPVRAEAGVAAQSWP